VAEYNVLEIPRLIKEIKNLQKKQELNQ